MRDLSTLNRLLMGPKLRSGGVGGVALGSFFGVPSMYNQVATNTTNVPGRTRSDKSTSNRRGEM